MCEKFIRVVLKETFDGCVKKFGTNYGLVKPDYEFKNVQELNGLF